ncbi:hypothetical protein V497_00142 [Pseudogymnoascus sp. VKM F-4516 (FW-969)]|nr:hypothetical protein V497_00142 [Pseudogymnoascus sp. VKM F-4516 (FW-969)]
MPYTGEAISGAPTRSRCFVLIPGKVPSYWLPASQTNSPISAPTATSHGTAVSQCSVIVVKAGLLQSARRAVPITTSRMLNTRERVYSPTRRIHGS